MNTDGGGDESSASDLSDLTEDEGEEEALVQSSGGSTQKTSSTEKTSKSKDTKSSTSDSDVIMGVTPAKPTNEKDDWFEEKAYMRQMDSQELPPLMQPRMRTTVPSPDDLAPQEGSDKKSGSKGSVFQRVLNWWRGLLNIIGSWFR